MGRFEYISGAGGFETPDERARVSKKLRNLRADFNAGSPKTPLKKAETVPALPRASEASTDHRAELRAELERINAAHAAELAELKRKIAKLENPAIGTRLTDPEVFARAARITSDTTRTSEISTRRIEPARDGNTRIVVQEAPVKTDVIYPSALLSTITEEQVSKFTDDDGYLRPGQSHDAIPNLYKRVRRWLRREK